MSSDGVHTIGVAIPVPDPWGTDLQERRATYGDRQAWTIPTHITLLPPTQVRNDRMKLVDAHLTSVAADQGRIDLALDGAASFRPITPTVYLKLGRGAEECTRLEARVRSGPVRRRLAFPYHPHVTLAFDVADEVLDLAFAEHAEFRLAFTASSFSRYELGEDGIWLPECDFAFGGDAP